MQAGPGFFDSFRSKGKTLIHYYHAYHQFTLSDCCQVQSMRLASIHRVWVGLVAGALTSTRVWPLPSAAPTLPLASIAYGIAYPFGVIGVILFVRSCCRR
ncbi:MAG: hypothetical protein ACLULL_06090 [Parabacteroides distasonis]